MQLMISEILDKIQTYESTEDKIAWLRKNRTPALLEILQYCYNPSRVLFTNTAPKHILDMAPPELSYNSLFSEYKRLYIFLDSTKINPKRKMELLIQMLESIHPSDAALLVSIVNRTIKIPGCNSKLVQRSFPDVNFLS
jgi:hypothetical protein